MRGVSIKFLVSLFCFLPALCWAQNKVYPYRAQTIREEVNVFKEANFDSEIIATLSEGQIFDISSKKFNGAFYRLRVKPGVLGYVSDADVRTLTAAGHVRKSSDPKKNAIAQSADGKGPDDGKNPGDQKRKNTEEKRKNRPFQYTQFAGFQYSYVQFQEDTMGDKRQEDLGFFGAKVSGPNLIIEGAIPTEMNFLFHYGAPSYYEKLTGKAADGWVLLMDFLFQNYYPQGKNALAFFGFGPMLRYSKFNASITDKATGKATDYSMEDMALGGVFNAGVAFRLNRVALRGELLYYWESLPYLGASLSVQFAF